MHIQYVVEAPSTKVHFFPSFEKAEPFWKKIRALPSSVLLLTEETAGSLFIQKIEQKLNPSNLSVFTLTLPSGEKVKSRSMKELVEDFLIEKEFGKSSCIIALGGGALLDLASFVASTYARGIDLVLIPTTLLAMVDACLGGKTALNISGIKNIIGTFYPAKDILIATEFLSSLPMIEKQSAFAEVLKYGAICDASLFCFLQENVSCWQAQDPEFLEKIIYKSLYAKKTVVESDFQEKGLRRILNFGHTMGHAIESLFEYRMHHGIAISIGMALEAHISLQMGFLSKEDFLTFISLWNDYGFNKNLPSLSYERLSPFFAFDKKNANKAPRFVLMEKLGKASSLDGSYCTNVSLEIIKNALNWYATL